MDSTERYRYVTARPLNHRPPVEACRTTRSSTTSDEAAARFIDRLLARDNELVEENAVLTRENALLASAVASANKRLLRMRRRICFLLCRLAQAQR